MSRKRNFAIGLIAMLGASLGLVRSYAAADEITVFAAASLKEVLEESARQYERGTSASIRVVPAGTALLARQIESGAPADIFISASADWMDWLVGRGAIDEPTRIDLARNRLVLVGYGETVEEVDLSKETNLLDLLGGGRLAMALTNAVPAGIYGKAALESLNQWDQVSRRVAQADNVRAALAYVASGEAPLGIVYATDAAVEESVSVLYTFPADLHPPIVYPAAATNRARLASIGFLDFLQSPEAREIFRFHGFGAASP